MFSVNNTEGFTKVEIDTLNAAAATIAAQHAGLDDGNIGDLVNNAFQPGISAAEIVNRVNRAIAGKR